MRTSHTLAFGNLVALHVKLGQHSALNKADQKSEVKLNLLSFRFVSLSVLLYSRRVPTVASLVKTPDQTREVLKQGARPGFDKR